MLTNLLIVSNKIYILKNFSGSFLLNGVTDYHKCKMKAYVTIRNL